MDLMRVVILSLVAVTLSLGLQRAGIVGRQAPEPPHPPTPAFLATRAAEVAREAERREATAQDQAARNSTSRSRAAEPVAAALSAETPAALPEGPGQEATFHACTGCHGTALIRRSRLSRDRWDELMDWMTERHGMPPLQSSARVEIVDYLAEHFRPQRRGTPSPFLAPPAE